MDKLILAQGAEHTNQERLKSIINFINADRDRINTIYGGINNVTLQTKAYLHDKFAITPTNDYREMRYVTEEKFDGYSYLNQGGEFYSKRLSTAKGNEGMPVCKSDSIHITPILRKAYEMCGANLHGELFIPGGISDDVTKILGCTPELAMERTMAVNPSKRLHYMLIDIREYMGHNLINEPYWVRRSILEWVYKTYGINLNQTITQ